MEDPVRGEGVRCLSDGCVGVVQWVRPASGWAGVWWDDGTTSMEVLGEQGKRWERVAEINGVHVCDDACQCPDHPGRYVWYHRASDTHACQRADCRYAAGIEEQLEEAYRASQRRLWENTTPAAWGPGA